jgi:septal ring factor EnvC (AmiA/AmiB activator)
MSTPMGILSANRGWEEEDRRKRENDARALREYERLWKERDKREERVRAEMEEVERAIRSLRATIDAELSSDEQRSGDDTNALLSDLE